MSAGQTPSLEQVMRQLMDTRLCEVHVSIPCVVQSYDATAKTVDCAPVAKRPVVDDEGNIALEELPVLPAVPVCFPRGGGYRLRFPLVKGDPVLVVFSMFSFDQWRQTGQINMDGDCRVHSAADAIAIPGIETVAQASNEAGPTEHMTLGAENGLEVTIDDDAIHLGKHLEGEFVALANKVDVEIQKIKSMFSSWTPVPNDGGAALKTLSGSWTPASTAAEKVKAK